MARTKQVARRNFNAAEAEKLCRNSKPTKSARKIFYREAKKVNRYRPGTVALREIKRYQQTGNTLIPKLAFARLIRQVCGTWLNMCCFRIQREAMLALQEAAEIYLAEVFEDSYRVTIHARRVTLLPKDMWLVLRIRGESRPQ